MVATPSPAAASLSTRPTLQLILRACFAAFAATRPLPNFIHQAVRRMVACRTAALGGHIQRCPHGHLERVHYNSCRHRFCPNCSAGARQTWLARRMASLLDCPHFHVIFTVPSEFNPLWRYNKRLFAKALFHAARDALAELLADPKYLGAQPGLLLALHTWGQTLSIHPHVHALVTAGGLSGAGDWRRLRKRCLLPRRVLMMVFRGKLLDALRRTLQSGDLQLPPDTRQARLRSLFNRLGRVDWNVKILSRYEHGRGVLLYLARYLRGGPISDGRLVAFDGRRVTFRYRDHRQADDGGHGPRQTTTLSAEEFLSRWLEHLPPPGLHTVRGYGLYANGQKDRREQARRRLGRARPSATPELSGDREAAADSRAPRCPVCGTKLICVQSLARAPPQAA